MGFGDAAEAGNDAGFRKLVDRMTRLEAELMQVRASSVGRQGQIDFLTNQVLIAEQVATETTVEFAPGVGTPGWVTEPFSSVRDTALDVTTSSTGILAVQVSAYVGTWSNGSSATAIASVGCEVRRAEDDSHVRGPLVGDGPYSRTVGAAQAFASPGQWHLFTLEPSTAYTLRTRRQYNVWLTGSGDGSVAYAGSSLAAIKIGM